MLRSMYTFRLQKKLTESKQILLRQDTNAVEAVWNLGVGTLFLNVERHESDIKRALLSLFSKFLVANPTTFHPLLFNRYSVTFLLCSMTL